MVDKWPEGPTEEQRSNEKNIFVGIVENDKGETVSAKLTTPEGYTTTYLTTLKAVREVMAGNIKLIPLTANMSIPPLQPSPGRL